MARGHPVPHPPLDRFRRHDFDEPGLIVAGLVDMDVDEAAGFFRQIEGERYVAEAVLAGKLVMGNSADHVGAQFDRPPHLRLSAGKGVYPVLGKGDDLDVHDILHRFPDLGERADGREGRVGRVRVGPYVPHPRRNLPFYRFHRIPDDHVFGQEFFPLAPNLDSLEKGSRFVEPRVADAEYGVEMQVRIDERRRNEMPRRIDFAVRPCGKFRREGGKQSPFDSDIPKGFFAPQPAIPEDYVHFLTGPCDPDPHRRQTTGDR